MRPYRVVDDEYDDSSYSRVVPISSAPGARGQAAEQPPRREPWTPRDDIVLPAARRPEPPPPLPSPKRATFSETHQIMLATFLVVCFGMVLAMIAWRIWWQAPVPPMGGTSAIASPPVTQAEPALGPPPDGSGPLTTEIKVLQPNYSVVQGDTLASIARRHNTSVDTIASLNNLENRNALTIGQRLVIP